MPSSVSTAARSPPVLSLARKAKIRRANHGRPWKLQPAAGIALAASPFEPLMELRPKRGPVLEWPMTGSNPRAGAPLASKNFGRRERSSLFSRGFPQRPVAGLHCRRPVQEHGNQRNAKTAAMQMFSSQTRSGT